MFKPIGGIEVNFYYEQSVVVRALVGQDSSAPNFHLKCAVIKTFAVLQY